MRRIGLLFTALTKNHQGIESKDGGRLCFQKQSNSGANASGDPKGRLSPIRKIAKQWPPSSLPPQNLQKNPFDQKSVEKGKSLHIRLLFDFLRPKNEKQVGFVDRVSLLKYHSLICKCIGRAVIFSFLLASANGCKSRVFTLLFVFQLVWTRGAVFPKA